MTWFYICLDQVIDGLDKAVKTMKKGEIALITIQPEYAFGQSDSPQELAIVPGNSTVYYDIEMLSFIKVSENNFLLFSSFKDKCQWIYTGITFFFLLQDKDSWDMKNTQEKIEGAIIKKEQGNSWFKAGKYERAAKRYEKV